MADLGLCRGHLGLQVGHRLFVAGFQRVKRRCALQAVVPVCRHGQQVEIDLLPGGRRGVGGVPPAVLKAGKSRQQVAGLGQFCPVFFQGLDGRGQRVVPQGAAAHVEKDRFQQQAHKAHPLVHLGTPRLRQHLLIPHTLQQFVDPVDLTILLVQLVVDGKIPRHLLVLQVLGGQLLADRKPQFLVVLQDLGEVFPRTGRHHGQAVHGGLDLVEILRPDVQIADDAAADPMVEGVGFPRRIVRLDLDHLQAVAGGGVKLPDALVEAGRVSGGDHHPALGDLVPTEHLILQKEQHGRRQCLGNAVDLVEEKDALGLAGGAHTVVDAGNDLAHGVLADLIGLAAVRLFHNDGQTQRALAGVVGHGVADQTQPHLVRDLLHDGRFAQTRRTQQEHRPLMHQRHPVAAQRVFLQVDLHRILDLLFCTCYIHDSASSVWGCSVWSRRMLSVVRTARMAQLGTFGLMKSSRLKTNAVL